MFVFDLETHNNQEIAEACAAGLYDVNRLQDRWERDLTPDELVTKKDNVIIFDATNANPVINMPKYNSANYEGDERLFIGKNGVKIVSSSRLSLVAHNASGFDSSVVLNSIVNQLRGLKFVKNTGGLISLLFR